jgi:serine protease Do
MDKFNRLNGSVKAAGIVALVLVLTGALVLLAAEKAERGFLGVSVQRLDDEAREKLGIIHGVRVVDIEKESSAAKAGIQKDDVIQSVNDEKIRDAQSLLEAVRELAPGSTAKIGLWRGGKPLELTATLGKYERPEHFIFKREMLPHLARSTAYLGVILKEMSADLAAYFAVKAGEGVLITDVEKETPAEKAGLKPGDVIVQFTDKAVKESGDVHEALAALKKGDHAAIMVVRHGKRETLKVEPDFSRHERTMRIFRGGKDFELEHLELPEMDIEIPDFDLAPPCPPDAPDAPKTMEKVHKSLDEAMIKIDKHFKKIGENSWI